MFKDGSRVLGYTILGIVALAVCSLIAVFAFGGVGWLTAPFRGEVDKKNRTEGSGAFRIATYEEFFDLCAAAQTAEQQLAVLQEELDGKPSPERAEKVRTSITAVKASRAESINTYNSKASQEHRSAFQDADLPVKLDPTAQETQCAA
ncbi:hypothetical protein PV413_03485 [Streptomyces scabiei]|uniref:hypothetical protein n=1 Tax=Streptomyces scabiei TaxID=1930 RepID=UPI000E68D6D1|nr:MULTISPECIES: hypothetical protein [Streptomyces]MDX2749596.1 hypothetical protein [Streptomyces scabiei]MDX3146536.1 hypothetical protein [Streptomyces scabiei]MDX3196942.1 hypothetical protein [Streptomyces scabiei]QTU45916.1 hypothetical protein F3K20_14505 [Streptomyces sp. LBUM 1482]